MAGTATVGVPTGGDADIDADSRLHRENIAFAREQIDGIIKRVAIAIATPAEIQIDLAISPPSYVIERVLRATPVDTFGILNVRVPAYRTVRGFDEKRRRPVLYQTLVHEERPQRAVIDRSTNYHIALRRRDAHDDATSDQKRQSECAIDDNSCPTRSDLDPLSLSHVALTVSVDKDGARAITRLRRANGDEVRAFFAAHIKSIKEPISSATYTSQEAKYLAMMRDTFLPMPLLLARGGMSSAHSDSHRRAISSSVTQVGRLKVMSINIWNYNYWTRRQSQLRALLLDHRPDVVGFQEVRAVKSGPTTGQGRYQIEDLAKMIPEYEYVYAPAMGFYEGSDYVQEGLAIFSRFPILSSDARPLSRDPHDPQDFHQRVCLHAAIATPYGVVHMLTTHLSLSLRARQRTLPEVNSFASSFGSEPTILVGDFNAQFADGPSLLTDASIGGSFRDAWSEVHGSTPESDRMGWTFNSWDHRSRIDFIFYRSIPGQMKTELQISRIEVTGTEGRSLDGEPLPPIGGVADMKDTMFPSDHMFLVGEFNIRNTEQQHPSQDGAQPNETPHMYIKDEL